MNRPDGHSGSGEETPVLLAQVWAELTALRAGIEALNAGLDHSNGRAQAIEVEVDGQRVRTDALERRSDQAAMRADAGDDLAKSHGVRLETLEERVDIDEAMIAELHADGVLGLEHVAQLQEALTSSRIIGAAVGVVMAARGVDQEQAFQLLSKASQDTNRRLRLIAEDVLLTRDDRVLHSRRHRKPEPPRSTTARNAPEPQHWR